MKKIFIPAKTKFVANESKISQLTNKLPKKIVLAYSIQYQEVASNVKEVLSKKHKILGMIQALGCSKPKIPKGTEAILLVTSGKFHGVSLAYETKLPVFVLENNRLTEISSEDVSKLEKKRKASYMRYLHAEKVGMLISTKPGQERFKNSLDSIQKIKDKKTYIFLANNVNSSEFENFQIDSWINTACPRMDMNDNSVINLADLNL